MNKIIICILVVAAGLYSSPLQAQIISAGAGTEFSIGAGTTVSADGLELTPAALYSFSNITLSKSNTVSNSTSLSYINSVYQFSATAPSFSGALKMYYNNSELNGLTPSGLKLLVYNGKTWSLDNNSSSNSADNVVFNNAVIGVSLKEITAGNAAVPLLSVTPLSQTICSGSSITPIVFSDINNKVGTTYSWTRDNALNVNGISASSGSGQSISGIFANNTNTVQVTTFTIKATNSNGSSTKTVSLTVNPSLAIRIQPASVAIHNGSNTSLAVNATGVGITYQWQVSTNSGGRWSNIVNNSMYAGAKTMSLNITKATLLMNGYLYRCIVSSSICGSPITSSRAKLTVNTSTSNLTTLNQVKTQIEGGIVFKVHASPNPSPLAFKVYVTAPGKELIDVLITDIRGMIIKSVKVKPNESIMLGYDLAASTYVLIATQGSYVSTTKIVKL